MSAVPLRIAYVINSMEGGGAQSPLPAIIRSIEANGAEVRLFALARKDGKAIPRVVEAGIEPHVFDGSLSDHLGALRWLQGEFKDFDPNAIWTSLTRATLLGQKVGRDLRVPVASWQHSAYLKPWNERLLRLRRKASAFWIADSTEVAQLTRQRLKLAPEKVVTWPIFAADPDTPTPARWQNGEKVRIGALGRLHVSKAYDVLLEALAILRGQDLPDFELIIGGQGPEGEALKEQTEKLGLNNVTLAGFIDRPAEFLAGLHLYIQPSRREGFCIAMHEAMAAGLPVVVSDVGEMPHTVDSETMGRVVPAEDAAALAEALGELLAEPQYLAAMGEAGRQRVLDLYPQDRFERVAAEIVERLRELARG